MTDDVFAIVCASLAGAGESLPAVVDEERIPLVTPLPFASASRFPPSTFFLFSDLESQTLALARHAGSGPRNVAIVHADTPAARAAAAALEEHAAAAHWTLHAAARSDDDLLFLIGVDPKDVLPRLAAEHWKPHLLVAGAPLHRVPEYGNDIALAVPTLPADWSAEGEQELRAFAERHKLPADHLAAQIAPYATAKVFVEALKRAGRDLTREKLIATLESFYQFPTGLTQPVSYTRGRHIGASGAFIVAVDRERGAFLPAGEWTRGD